MLACWPTFFLSASCPKSSPGSYLWQLLPITGSRWPNRACLGLRWCPSLLGSQNRTQGHTGPSLGLPFFLGAFLLRQGCQISLQLVIHRLLDRTDRIEQIPVAHHACLCFYFCRLCINEPLLFQLPYVFCNRVSAHTGMLADLSNTRPALVVFSVLTKYQVSVDRQFARA